MHLHDVILYSIIAGTATLFGTWMVLKNEALARRHSMALISFAAGVMLAISFSHLLPESVEMSTAAWPFAFGGFLAFYLLQQAVMFHACHEEECHTHHLGTLSFAGLTIHSFLDGLAIAVGFEASWSLGLLTTLAVLLHEVPEGITITGILLHANAPRPRVVRYSVIVAVATPLGAILSYFFLHDIGAQVLGALLAFTAGSFIYLAAADLLPETHKEHNWRNAVFFFLGVGLLAVVGAMLH